LLCECDNQLSVLAAPNKQLIDYNAVIGFCHTLNDNYLKEDELQLKT
jgi:hypothetical protein